MTKSHIPRGALVTGAASGIGQAITIALATRGVGVIAADLVHPAKTLELGAGLKGAVVGTLCDVTQAGALERAIALTVERFGGIDIMINNAGIAGRDESFLTDTRQSLWAPTVDINLTSVIRGTQLAVEAMTAQGRGGVVINIASLAAYHGEMPVYAATKAGVLRFSRSLHFLAPQRNIRVQAICPAFARTPILKSMDDKTRALNEKAAGGILEVSEVVSAILKGIDATEGGLAIRVTKRRGAELMAPGERASKI